MTQKYGAALISIALVAFVFLKTALADSIDPAEVAQLVALVAGAVIVYIVPLLNGRWAGALKTGASVLAALATALGPFVLQGYVTPEQWTIVAIAVLNVLGVELGVSARTTLIDAGTYEMGQVATITSVPEIKAALAQGGESPTVTL